MEPSSQQTVLIIEDEPSVRRALRHKLELEGFTVAEAGNGKEGLRQALEIYPDLIILDIMMPLLNGEQVLKQLREDEWGKTVPVIVLTNTPFLEDEESKQRSSEYLMKSATKLDQLMAVVLRHMPQVVDRAG